MPSIEVARSRRCMCFIWLHTFSIGLRSGLFPGHPWKTLMPFRACQACVDFARCAGALSSMNWNCFLEPQPRHFLMLTFFSVAWYSVASMVLPFLRNSRDDLVDDVTAPNIITLTGCLVVVTTHSGSKASPGRRRTN